MEGKELSREELVDRARLGMELEWYEQLRNCIDNMIRGLDGEGLTAEEKDLFAEAYFKPLEGLKITWTRLNQDDTKQRYMASTVKFFQNLLKQEVQKSRGAMVNLIDECFLRSDIPEDQRVFYLELKGDILFSTTEFAKHREKVHAKVKESYIKAQKISLVSLSPLHPSRLALALSMATFYKVAESSGYGVSLATQAVQDAEEAAIHNGDPIDPDAEELLNKLRQFQ